MSVFQANLPRYSRFNSQAYQRHVEAHYSTKSKNIAICSAASIEKTVIYITGKVFYTFQATIRNVSIYFKRRSVQKLNKNALTYKTYEAYNKLSNRQKTALFTAGIIITIGSVYSLKLFGKKPLPIPPPLTKNSFAEDTIPYTEKAKDIANKGLEATNHGFSYISKTIGSSVSSASITGWEWTNKAANHCFSVTSNIADRSFAWTKDVGSIWAKDAADKGSRIASSASIIGWEWTKEIANQGLSISSKIANIGLAWTKNVGWVLAKDTANQGLSYVNDTVRIIGTSISSADKHTGISTNFIDTLKEICPISSGSAPGKGLEILTKNPSGIKCVWTKNPTYSNSTIIERLQDLF